MYLDGLSSATFGKKTAGLGRKFMATSIPDESSLRWGDPGAQFGLFQGGGNTGEMYTDFVRSSGYMGPIAGTPIRESGGEQAGHIVGYGPSPLNAWLASKGMRLEMAVKKGAWIYRFANANGKRVGELLILPPANDPMFRPEILGLALVGIGATWAAASAASGAAAPVTAAEVNAAMLQSASTAGAGASGAITGMTSAATKIGAAISTAGGAVASAAKAAAPALKAAAPSIGSTVMKAAPAILKTAAPIVLKAAQDKAQAKAQQKAQEKARQEAIIDTFTRPSDPRYDSSIFAPSSAPSLRTMWPVLAVAGFGVLLMMGRKKR